MAKTEIWAACIRHLLADPRVRAALDTLRYAAEMVAALGETDGDAARLDRAMREAEDMLAVCGLGLAGNGAADVMIAVPAMSDAVGRLFGGTEWANGAYWGVLRKAPARIVIRAGAGEKTKIGGVGFICVYLSVAAWRDWEGRHQAATPIAHAELRRIVEGIERLEEEKKTIQDDIKEQYAVAKATGFDAAIIRRVVKYRAMDAAERAAAEEADSLAAVYLAALGDALGEVEAEGGVEPEPD